MTHPESFLSACNSISLEALDLGDECAETITQLRTLVKSIQPQLLAGSAAHELARIAYLIADDHLKELNQKLPRLRRELGADQKAVSPTALATAP